MKECGVLPLTMPDIKDLMKNMTASLMFPFHASFVYPYGERPGVCILCTGPGLKPAFSS